MLKLKSILCFVNRFAVRQNHLLCCKISYWSTNLKNVTVFINVHLLTNNKISTCLKLGWYYLFIKLIKFTVNLDKIWVGNLPGDGTNLIVLCTFTTNIYSLYTFSAHKSFVVWSNQSFCITLCTNAFSIWFAVSLTFSKKMWEWYKALMQWWTV